MSCYVIPSMEASFYSLTTVIVHNLRMDHPSKLFLEKILFLHAFVQEEYFENFADNFKRSEYEKLQYRFNMFFITLRGLLLIKWCHTICLIS